MQIRILMNVIKKIKVKILSSYKYYIFFFNKTFQKIKISN